MFNLFELKKVWQNYKDLKTCYNKTASVSNIFGDLNYLEKLIILTKQSKVCVKIRSVIQYKQEKIQALKWK